LLESVSRAEVTALRDLKGWAARHVGFGRLSSVLSELVGEAVTLRVDRAQPLVDSRPMDDGVAAVLSLAEEATIERGALVEAEAPLAANVVSRALRQPAPPLVRLGVTPSAAVVGAFAAVLLAASRRTLGGRALRVVCAGLAKDIEADMARRDPERWSVSLTVLLGAEAFSARVAVPGQVALQPAAAAWDRAALAALGPIPLALPVVACTVLATAAEVAALRAGDALVPPPEPEATWPLSRGVDSPAGSVFLAAPSAELGLSATLAEDGRLVLGGALEPLLRAGTLMTSDENSAVVATLGDVPVVVRVEIGEAVMTAREWASLGRGDVVSLTRRVGGPVLLRVGGVPVARGELVELDGEVAVRIVERLVGEETKA
jgi:flagellar motor switch/type III secretory pathway protein FliN